MTELDPCPFCGGKAEWDEKNNFYNRHEAYNIAMDNGQLSATTRQHKRDTGERELFSEDLY